MGYLFAMIRKLFSNIFLRKGVEVKDAADKVFTKDVHGYAAGFDLYRDQLVGRYQGLFDAVSEVETVVEQKRLRLKKVAEEKQESQEALEGALSLYEQAEKAGDTTTMESAAKDGEKFQAEVTEFEAKEDEVEADIKEQEGKLKDLERELTELQEEIEGLPEEKAEAIADFISSQRVKEAFERIHGLQTSIDTGPIEAIRRDREERKAQARVAHRLGGTDAKSQREKYVSAGKGAIAQGNFKQMLEARKAKQGQATGDTAPAGEEREKI